jgi:hypothetical protein
MTTHNGINIPCFGTLKEIHAALVKELNWIDEQVSINGWGYTVKEAGFQSNHNGMVQIFDNLQIMHPGTAILVRLVEQTTFPDLPKSFEIVTSGKIPHVSKRCAICGCQLDNDGVHRGACFSCYGEMVR